MKVLDIFSCIGSHALGLQAVGFKTVGFCEINPQRRALLHYHFPGIPAHDDVRTYHATTGAAEILIGGPPCQRTSVGAAIHGYRTGSTLWPEMLRISLELQPQWIVVEQPPGDTAWEEKIGRDLADAGYHSARSEFSAADLGAPHLRRRVFILAHACLQRLEIAWSAIPSEIEQAAGSTTAGNHWLTGPPGTLRVADGPSEWLDRNAAVEAIGDSNPPVMAAIIGRAILKAAR